MLPIDVFISHSRRDDSTAFAESLKSSMEAANIRCWVDKYDIENGTQWSSEIDAALKVTSLIMLIITPESMQSAYVTYEWTYGYWGLYKDLYFVHLSKSNDQAMFRRLAAMEFELPIYDCLHNDPSEDDFRKIVDDVKKRLENLSGLIRAGNNLIGSGIDNEERKQAAIELGQGKYLSAAARKWLLQGVDHQLVEGNGEVQLEIARALFVVANDQCVPALRQLLQLGKIYDGVRDAIEATFRRLGVDF